MIETLDAERPDRHDHRVDPDRRDRRLLLLSVWASGAFALVSSVWGILSGSSMIVFDGLSSFVSIGLSMLAVIALRTSRAGADERYPWGREIWEPVTVVVKAIALAALCVYAVVGGRRRPARRRPGGLDGLGAGLRDRRHHQRRVVTVLMRRGGRSDLVRAEAAEWFGDTLLSVGVLVGFVIAIVLVGIGRPDLAAYVDPAMVVIVSLLFLRIPFRLVGGGMREILSMSPPEETRAALDEVVEAVRARFGIEEAFLRASKVGTRVDVEVDFVVGEASSVRTVADGDLVRQALHDRLAELGHERSVTVAFTTERRWAL